MVGQLLGWKERRKQGKGRGHGRCEREEEIIGERIMSYAMTRPSRAPAFITNFQCGPNYAFLTPEIGAMNIQDQYFSKPEKSYY